MNPDGFTEATKCRDPLHAIQDVKRCCLRGSESRNIEDVAQLDSALMCIPEEQQAAARERGACLTGSLWPLGAEPIRIL